MTTRVGWYCPPNDPAAKAAAIQRNVRNGWAPVPGISDHEMGTVLRADDPTAPLWAPPIVTPPVRTIAAPSAHPLTGWRGPAAAIACCSALGGLCGVYVRVRWGS